MTTELPEFVYLITLDTERSVTAIIDCGVESSTAKQIGKAVERRRAAAHGWPRRDQAHVWRARLADVREVDLVDAVSLRERDNPKGQR